jgi:hypothetical protein
MVEMKDCDNRGQGNRPDHGVPKSVRLDDTLWKLERLDAIQRQLLTGLAAVGELYRLQDVWSTYSKWMRYARPDGSDRISASELLLELKPGAPTGSRDDVLEFGNALRLLKGLRAEVEASMRGTMTAETIARETTPRALAPASSPSNPVVSLV